MNKRGFLLFGVFGVLAIFFIFLFFYSAPIFAAPLPHDTYVLGERVKIDLRDSTDYRVKIITPSTTLFRRGDADMFIFLPEEAGAYSLIVEDVSGLREYAFTVVASITKDSAPLLPSSTMSEDIPLLIPALVERIPANISLFSSFENPMFTISKNGFSPGSSTLTDSLEGLLHLFRPRAELTDISGKSGVAVSFSIQDTSDSYVVALEDVRSLRPGLHKLTLTDYRDGVAYSYEQWFLWGVLAFNPDRSNYLLNDSALFSFGVLSDSGTVLCDADLIVVVTNPSGLAQTFSTMNDTIFVSNTCGYLGVISQSDYFMPYSFSTVGQYTLNITAVSENGVYSVTDLFTVHDSLPFSVRRAGPTRVYPYIDQVMRFYVTAYENYSGQFIELVPNSFTISSDPAIVISSFDSETLSLSWDVDFVAGETYELTYEFDTPEVSPYLYFVGPFHFGSFHEGRRWQIANDAEVTLDASVGIPNEQYGTGAAVVFVNGTTGYAFYFDGGPQLSYTKTTNGGVIWDTPVVVTSQTDAYTFAIWYDMWTPNYNGTLINIVFGETGTDSFFYKYLNTTGDTLSTEVDATGDIGRLREEAQNPSIVRASSGNLFISGADDNSGNEDIWKSTNNGTSWASTTGSAFNTDFNDEFALIPLPGGDIFALHADDSAADLIARRYNESTDAWIAGVTIDSTFDVSTTADLEASWGATLDLIRGYIYVVGNNNPGAAGADLESYFYNGTGWSTRTDVYTNIGAAGRGVKVSFGSNNNTVYATYTRAPGGTATSSDIYRVASVDNMTTWSGEVQVSTTQDDLKHPRPDLVNSQRLYVTWINDGANDLLGNTLFYNSPTGPQPLSGNYFSSSTVTSVAVAPLDYNRFVLAWCDDALDTINVAVYYTNGTGLTDYVDSSAGACTANSVGASVSVAGFDTSSFVVGWYDSPDSDISFVVYNTTLANQTTITDVDTDAGASAAVSVSALNSTAFVIGWYDATSEDATFRTYSRDATAISSETDVDTTAGAASNSVSVSAVNSSNFMFAWFDDTDNDASLQPYSFSGSPLAGVFDADSGAGDSRAVSVSTFNSSSVIFAWYDAGSSDASFRTHLWNATPISAGIDADADVGTARSTAVTSLAQWRFGLDWYDLTTDTGIFVQTFLFNTTVISSEITVQSAALQYADIGSEEYATGLQLCEDAFVVAVANTTSQNFWRLYYPNGTVWDGTCPTNVPIISNVNVSAITAFTAFVNWSTNVYANSSIDYGTSLSLGTVLGSSFTRLVHGFNLTGLSPGQTYYFNVTSCIDGRCNSSGGYSFSTGIGDGTPFIGEPIASQIWTVNTSVRYVLNFTNNGTVASNYTLNVTNLTGATYVYLNQSSFLNVNNGTTVFFEINLSASTNGTYRISVNATSALSSTMVDGAIFTSEFLNPYVMSNGSITSVANAPLDYNRLVTVWCDDTEDDITFGVYNTTGYLLTAITDIDTSAGACSANTAGHSVAVTALDHDRFVVVWYDSGDSDTTFQIFYSNGTAVTSATDLDTDASASLAVSVTPLNSTAFTAAWYDDTSDDISAAVYSSTGSTITSLFDIDTDVGATAQGVEVSGVNSTAFGVIFFDDSGGGGGIADVYYQLYDYTGTAISSVTTIDSNAGNSRSVSLAVMNESSLVASWVDVNDAAKRYTVLYPNGTTRVAVTTVDADATGGEDVRVSAITHDDFAITWHDPTTDVGTYAQTIMNNGTSISSTVTVGSNTQQYTDVASEEYTTQIQLCENAYAVAFASTTTNAVWSIYYPNGTAWNGVCPTYAPQIQNVNVSAITITSAFVNWSTDVEANSSIIYGTTLSLSSGSNGSNFPKTVHGFNLTGLSGQTTYYFNVTSCIDGRCNTTGPHSFTTSTVDTTLPFVSLVSPANGSTLSKPYDFEFVYNVTDTSNIVNCSLFIDGSMVRTSNSVSNGVNQTFYHYLSNGTYLWSVGCTDQYGNANVTENRTITVNAGLWSFGRRFYETYISNGVTNQTAVIWLNNSQDSTQNTVGFNITAQTTQNIMNASTSVMGANGAVIPSGSIVDFSSSFSVSSANVLITWKIFITNSSGNTLLCQNGDDGAGGTVTAGTATGQNTTCISRDIRLGSSDRLTYLINAYNTHATQVRSILHAWDSPTSSFVDINVTTEGFLQVDLTYPTTDASISTGQQLNVTCQASCTVGYCRNTHVYLQRNSTTESWTNVGATGNIILAGSETNPHSLGNLTTTAVATNFSIQGNADSDYNYLRCIAVSTYDARNGTTQRRITVGQSDVAPVVQLTNPANATWYATPNVTVFYNVTDVNSNVVNATLILNGAYNATNASAITLGAINNFSIVNLLSGMYVWNVNATDQTNLVGTNHSTRTFYVDAILPLVNLSTPANATAFQVNSVEFNFSTTDNLDTSLICNLTVDTTVEHANIASTNGTLISRTVSNLAVGVHYWNVTCVDEAGNVNTSITRTFTIADTPPVVDLITANATYTTNGNITLTYNSTDNNGFLYTQLILNGLVNQTNQTAVLNGQYNNFSLSNLGEGIYLWNVNATDTGGLNSTNHSSRTFIVDLRAPNVTLNLPTNASVWNTSTINFNFTVVDTIDSSLTCGLYVGDRSDLSFSATNGSVTNRQMTGLVDGGHLWNVSCVDDAGWSNYSQTWLVNVTEVPRITLNTVNNSFFNTTTFNLSYTPSDNTNLSLCELYVDGTYNQTHTTPTNGALVNFTVSGIGSGVHTWYVVCNDTYELTNVSQIRTFTVDTNGLNVSLVYPLDGAQFFTLNLNLSFNATDNIDPVLLCNITVNNVVVNTSLVSSGSIVNRSVTFASGGLKYWNVTCFDDASNSVTSTTWNFTLEQAPSVGLVNPANNTFSNSSTIAFFYNVLDDNNNLANATLILNGLFNQTNTTVIVNDAENNLTVTLPDGFYNWTINVTDQTNLVGTETPYRVLTVDTRMPWVTLNYPSNNTILSTNNVTFNYTAYDLIDQNITCNISIDDVSTVTNIGSLNGTDVLRYVVRSDGTYTWNVNCRDDALNTNYTETRTFTVEAPPLVTNLAPSNEQYLNSSNVTFVYRPEDAIGIYNCSLFLDGVYNSTSGTISANANNSFTVGGVPEGRHSWNVSCYDVFPDFNYGGSNLTNFTVDVTFPQIALHLPLNASNTLRLVSFNFTATDNLDTNLSCNLYTDSVLNMSSINASNGTAMTQSVNRFALGQHTWNVSCIDEAGNRNWSLIQTFNVTLADFMINFSDIRFNMTSPTENDTVMVNATIHNLINVTVPNVTISFFQGDPSSGGIQLGPNYTAYDIFGLTDTIFSINWSVPLGTSQIYVHIDPPITTNGSIEEWNETNNQANNSATVDGWQYVYGFINSASFFNLADTSQSSVVIWNATNVNGGRIYVTDSESSVSWTELRAIGHNKTNSNTTNDFTDIDSLLSMTTFGDSVTRHFSNGTRPTNATNLLLFNSLVTEIPLGNSTNSTTFMTGILWDSSDDIGDGQYSQEDKEDLVFFTTISKNTQGAYGVYDYEMRIPARLREYFVAESRGVVFYTEIF
jgi:hypothetical protein